MLEFPNYAFLSLKIVFNLANSAFHLGLHCLPSNLFTDHQYKKGIKIRMDRNCLYPEFKYHYKHASCSNSVVAELVTEVLAPKVTKFLSCSTQLSTKFQLLIKAKIRTNKKILALSLSDVVFTMLINVKMPTIVDIFTFMSRMNFALS